MKDIDIKIRWVDKLRNNWAIIHKPNKNRSYYLIKICRHAPLWEIAGTFLHEMLHMLFWIYFTDEAINASKEHEACESVDQAGQDAVREYMGVNEDV